MPNFLISPAEPPLIKTLGTVAMAPEKYGSDILWADGNAGGLIGVQRKEYTDLLASVADGRLQREIPQLRMCKMAFLLVEGKPHWSTDGVLVHTHLSHWTRESYFSLLRSVQRQGIVVEYTDSIADTITRVEAIAKWVAKGSHSSLVNRPKPGRTRWGQKNDRDTQIHLLQGVDGVGAIHAAAIVDHFGGLPLSWDVSADELGKVAGIGPKKVRALTNAIRVSDPGELGSVTDVGPVPLS